MSRRHDGSRPNAMASASYDAWKTSDRLDDGESGDIRPHAYDSECGCVSCVRGRCAWGRSRCPLPRGHHGAHVEGSR